MRSLILLAALALTACSTTVKAPSCDCPDDQYVREGLTVMCGGISSFCRSGGREPACGTTTEEERVAKYNSECG